MRLDGAAAGQRVSWVGWVSIGLISAALSIGRLLWANPSALTTVLWAEDGAFPLCVRKVGFFSCLVDPFAGYSLFVPRVLAGITGYLPMDAWAASTNVIAALLAGVVGALAFITVRRYGVGLVAGIVIALLPAIAPIMGFESLNVIASCYMLLLFLVTLALALPSSPVRVWWLAALLLITALTIPSAALLLLIILVQVIRKKFELRAAVVMAVALILGLAVQLWFALTAVKPRAVTVGWESFQAWVNAVPSAILTYWPGLNLAEAQVFTNYVSRPSAWTGYLVVALIVVAGVYLCVRTSDRKFAAGLLLLAGVGYGAFPSLIGFANNRYFVVPCLLWAAALFLLLDPVLRRTSPAVLAVGLVAVLVIWRPALAVSAWRSTPAPVWSDQLALMRARCLGDPGVTERIFFTPYWPPDWGGALSEPTTTEVSCLQARKW